MSDKDAGRRLTRQAIRELADSPQPATETPRRSAAQSSHHSGPEHLKRCFLCQSAEDQLSTSRRRRRSSVSKSSESGASSSSKTTRGRSRKSSAKKSKDHTPTAAGDDNSSVVSGDIDLTKIEYSPISSAAEGEDIPDLPDIGPDLSFIEDAEKPSDFLQSSFTKEDFLGIVGKEEFEPEFALLSSGGRVLGSVVEAPSPVVATSTVTLAQSGKSQPVPKPVPAPNPYPSALPANVDIPLPSAHSYPNPQAKKAAMMANTGGPVTRSQSHGLMSLDGGHRQISAANIDEASLDQFFQISPKWHYVKTNFDETAQWLENASFESILLELLYFVHDQGDTLHHEMEGTIEKEVQRAIDGMDKLECLDAFCKTFIREGRFRPAGKVTLSGSGKDEKNNRLFRLINADLQNLKKQHHILSMVCAGTADHEVHTQAQRENLRKLVEDLVTIVHPCDRATYSEVYKVITENATYDHRADKPQLSSLKLVSHPDIVVPFGGPIVAGGSQIRCDALEHKIRAKLPSVLVKMHFSDKAKDQKWPDRSRADDSGIASTLDGLDETPTGTGSSRSKGKDKPDDKSKASPATSTPTSSRSGKRKQGDEPQPSKRHRQEFQSHSAYDSQPPDSHVINEVYSEHVAQLITSVAQAPLGYVKHCRYGVQPSDSRDGTACVSVLGIIVSGDNLYFTKLDASHDYLDSLVESFRMDQLPFYCMANPLNLYKGAHIKALLLFLRYVCANFPRTTYFLSD